MSPTKHGINHAQKTTINATIHQWANAIIDSNMGALMEYRRLMKSPKHEKHGKNHSQTS
jgi:hypothetical protein